MNIQVEPSYILKSLVVLEISTNKEVAIVYTGANTSLPQMSILWIFHN